MRMALIPSLRERAGVENRWLRERLETVLPALMARTGFDMWIVTAREYNEDPLIMTLLPAPAMRARRRTILVFYRRDDGTVERHTVSRYGQAGYYESAWDPDTEPDQFAALGALVQARDPQRIGINISSLTAFADGLSASEYDRLRQALGDQAVRLESAESLCIAWLEARTPAELAAYPALAALGHDLIAAAFSRQVITPGVTTIDDVVWWFRQTMLEMGVAAWFQPHVDIQARGEPFGAFYSTEEQRRLIMPGDLLHCDVGFELYGLCTDQQQHAYVLRPGESAAPAGLAAALATGNRLQDIHMAQMAVGRTGNAVLADTLAQAETENIKAMVYSHPLGYHGHAAGPTIGLWDRQSGVPGRGDIVLNDNTVYSIELNIEQPVPEWNDQPVRIMLEEDAMLHAGQMTWLHGRQSTLHLIG